MQFIDLDHNATTPLAPEAATAMAECRGLGLANPASQHQAGRRARRLLEDAREAIGSLLGADFSGAKPDRLIFTSGGTESNNLAIFGQSAARPGCWISSGIEHPSVAAPLQVLASRGWSIERLPTSIDGVVNLESLPERLRRNSSLPRLVTVMLGNNETGVLQPVASIARLAREGGASVHTDAVQVVGKLPIDFRALGVDTLSFAAHKFHGPRGIGGLLLRHEVLLQPLMLGGFQQAGLRAGTESVELAVGLRAALELWQREADQRLRRMTALRQRLEARLKSAWPSAVVHGEPADRLPHCINISFCGLDRQALVMAIDLAGVACSTGSACASGSSEPSPVLLAMGVSGAAVRSSLRFSLGATTTEAEIDEAAARIEFVLRQSATAKSADRSV